MVRPILPKQEERESPDIDSVGQVRTPKRRCISTACIPCRRRKSKCDGATPACSTCNAVYRMECVYDTDGDRRRKSTADKDWKNDTLDNLVTRIRTAPENEVGTIVDQLRTKGSLAATLINNVKHDKQKASNEYSKEPERITFQDMGKLQVDDLGDLRHFGHSSSLESIHSCPRRASLAPAERVTTGPLWTNVTSDNDLISELLNLYFTWQHPVHVLLSKSCFLSDMKKHRTKYCSSLLVNAILALASHYSERLDVRSNLADSSTVGNHFFTEARRLLLVEEGRSSLTVAQALALMAMREAGCGRDSNGWMYCGRSLHVALDLGLHLPAKVDASSPFSPTEMEVRRITFWGLFVLDKLMSMHFGRIPQLPSSVVGIPKPSIIQQLEVEPWTSPDRTSRPCHIMEVATKYAELTEVLGDVLQALHSPKQQFDTLKLEELHTGLKKWRDQMPQFMDPQQDTVPAIFVLHMFYQSIILLIFRPFRHLVLSAFSETPRQIVTTAAIEICTVFSYYRNARFDTHSPGLIPHILLSAALVLLQENNTQTSIGSFDELRPMSSVVADNLEQCILDLRKMSSTWDLASQTLHVIWSRAANIDLPPRVKKALYPETSSSLALTQHFSFNPVVGLAGSSDQKMVEFNCDGYLEPSHNVEGFDGLGFAAGMGSGSDNAWLKTSGDEFQMAASVASLLEEVGCDVDLQLNAWDSYSV